MKRVLNFKNKKVLVMGLGLYEEGSGISAVRFLLSQGAKITVTDLKTKKQLAGQIKRLGKSAQQINWVLGKHRASDFRSADLIVKNPGVPNSSKYLKIARERQIPIESDISIFFQLVDRKRIIGITGTRGKSTTATLAYQLIKSFDQKAVLGGNITRSPLAQLAQIRRGGLVVLELSSWMLESLAPIRKSPHIAIITNIYPDHLNTYKNLAAYARAKENIFSWQNSQDYAIINRDNKYTKAMGQKVASVRFWISLKEFKEENGCFVAGGKIIFRRDGFEQNVCSIKDIKLPGEHNLANALAAICAAMIYGCRPAAVKKVLGEFLGIPDRLEFLKEAGGIKYYNDTTSTTPEATLAALLALAGGKKIVLIAGGADKGLDFKQLVREIKKHCRAVVLLKGAGTERIKKMITDYRLPITETDSMAKAVNLAKSNAKKGDIVLLSPACASFGLFKNEFDRGNQFRWLIKKIR